MFRGWEITGEGVLEFGMEMIAICMYVAFIPAVMDLLLRGLGPGVLRGMIYRGLFQTYFQAN